MVKGKCLSAQGLYISLWFIIRKTKIELTEIFSKLQFEKSRHYSNMIGFINIVMLLILI